MIKSIKKIKDNSGFVILFSVVLASIILSITLGVANIALKEIKFSTSAKETNYAFFAADTGIECALFNDKPPTAFPLPYVAPIPIDCASTVPAYDVPTSTYSFIVTGLGDAGTSCAIVSVEKDAISDPPNTLTTVLSKGYNVGDSSCTSSSSNRVEREIRVDY